MEKLDHKEVSLQGFPICPGIAIGKPFFFAVADENIPEFSIPDHEIEREVARYYTALKSSQKDLLSLQKRLLNEGGSHEATALLSSYLEMIHDPLMTVKVEEAIRSEGKNTEYVFKTVIGEYEQKFNKIPDAFFRERLKDFQDISRRIIDHLRKHERSSLDKISSRFIIFAHELSPSDTLEANSEYIEAIVTRNGGTTSHVAIMARAKRIPFVTSVDFPDLSSLVPCQVIVDGTSGSVIFNPSQETVKSYRQEEQKIQVRVQNLKNKANLEAETYDGYKAKLSANVDMYKEIDLLSHYGGEGVGLFRSEYLFLTGDGFPSEEEQFLVYKTIVEKVDGHPSVILIFDIGGDKFGNFHMARHERNPFLGCRGIRLMLKERAIFKTQIRAILRASAFGEVSILFPMISGLPELREGKWLVEEVKQELSQKGVPFARDIPMGCMVEVPSAALTCDLLAKECDFLSIGTNDLVQYALAVDRNNPAMSYLYSPMHPSIIRLIKMVVEEGNRMNTPVSVCGEIASDSRFIALLLGLGVHELSLTASSIPIVKNVIRHLSIVESMQLAEKVLALSTTEEVQTALEEAYQNLELEKT